MHAFVDSLIDNYRPAHMGPLFMCDELSPRVCLWDSTLSKPCPGHPVDSLCVCETGEGGACSTSTCLKVCMCERMRVYFSCCVLGSALNSAILSVFHHHLP